MNTYAPFYLMSAALSGDDAQEAKERTATLGKQLRRLGFVIDDVTGCYKGQIEPALIVMPLQRLRAPEHDILRLARAYGQESILAVDANRNARLLYCDGGYDRLGKFRNVPEAQARKRDAWTEREGQYYVCGIA